MSDYRDLGLTKIYDKTGNLSEVGVVVFLRKIGYWYYYDKSGEIIKIEYHNNDQLSPLGSSYIDILGSTEVYPVLNYPIPNNLNVIRINSKN